MKHVLFVIGFFCLLVSSKAQQSDTLIIDTLKETHSPTKATLLSLAVPGLGQAYNKKYWKIPVVYAIIGAPLYFAIKQRNSYNDFKSAYVARVDEDPNTIDSKYEKTYEDSELLSLIDFHRKNRDLLFVLTGLAYAMNVLDAAVDAHLYYFEVSDDLSARLKPSFQYSTQERFLVPSVTLSLKFAKKSHRHAF